VTIRFPSLLLTYSRNRSRVKGDKRTDAGFRAIRAELESLLLRGYFNARVHGFCKCLWEHRQNLWTFVEVQGVEPTSNAAEQGLRQAGFGGSCRLVRIRQRGAGLSSGY
jgi:hypothetical protein